jgi:hypothetical protein
MIQVVGKARLTSCANTRDSPRKVNALWLSIYREKSLSKVHFHYNTIRSIWLGCSPGTKEPNQATLSNFYADSNQHRFIAKHFLGIEIFSYHIDKLTAFHH